MSGAEEAFGAWLALLVIAGAAGCAVAGATSRSVVALCLSLWAAAALAVAALLALGRGEGALALAVLAVGLAPVLLLAAVLLSARIVKAGRRKRAWISLGGALAVVGAAVWSVRDLPTAAPARVEDATALILLAPLLLASVAAAVGMLGFGERGAFETFAEQADE